MRLFLKASYWAQRHPTSSRIIIALATILSVFLHYYYGIYLFAYDILIPYSFAIAAIVLGVSGALLYPIKQQKKGIFAYSYQKQKSLDFLIFMVGGLLVMYLGNQRAAKVFAEPEQYTGISQVIHSESPSSLYITVASEAQGVKNPGFTLSRSEMRKQLKVKMKELKKILRAEIKELRKKRKKDEDGDGRNVLLTILTILGALFLGFLVAAIACSLSCNGNELAGTVVLIIGWAGLLILSLFVIKKIFANSHRQKTKRESKDSSYPY